MKNNKLFIKFFALSLLFFMVWQAPKLALFDALLKSQPLAFNYNHISGGLTGFALHGVTPKKASAVVLPMVVVRPAYLSLFTGSFVADVTAKVSNGEITGQIKQSLFSDELSLDMEFNNITVSPQSELLAKTVFKSYLDSAKSTLSGNLKGSIISHNWLDKKNHMQLTFNLSATELALKNLGVIQAGDLNGTISMQEGALFADIHTLDDNKGFNFEFDARSMLAPRLMDSNIGGDIKLSFLGGNETKRYLFGNIGKPKLRPAK